MPSTEIKPETLEAMKKRLVDLSDTWKAGVTCGEAFDLGGNTIGGKGFTACHAWVMSVYGKKCFKKTSYMRGWSNQYEAGAENFIIGTVHSKTRSKGVCSVEAHEAIILWMASDDNPMSKYIINRDDKDSLLNGGLLILCGPDGATVAECMWMCKALRYGTEGGQSLDVWYKLYQGGVDPIFALFVATFVRGVKGATFTFTGAVYHCAVFQTPDCAQYGGSTPELGSVVTRKITPFAAYTHSLFSDPEMAKNKSVTSKGSVAKIKNFCQPVKIDDGWGKVITTQGADSDVFTQRVLDWQKELQQAATVPEPDRKPTGSTVFLDIDL